MPESLPAICVIFRLGVSLFGPGDERARAQELLDVVMVIVRKLHGKTDNNQAG
jgi:ADP-heptose:LPS heptosyltransferase